MKKEFEPVFIEFKKGNQESLNKAINKLEELGYKQWDYEDAMASIHNGILVGTKNGEYFSTLHTEQKLIDMGYKEIRLKEETTQQNLQSTQSDMGRYVTQIIHFSQGNKRTIKGIDTHTIKQGQFTKFYTKTGILVSINDKNVDMIETFTE